MTGLPNAPPQSMPFAPGTVVAGKYRIERLLGEGGMGWVVVAMHLHLEQRVALKFMREALVSDSTEAGPRFLREARAAARIQSEHVARVSDFGTFENGAPYLVMEYLEGQDLESLLNSQGALSIELAVGYAMQACEGLAEAHAAGIVHRDLKPANLFLARRSDGSVRVKLLDFGISKLAAATGAPEVRMTSTQALMGSPLYMAPEQMRSSKNVDGRADIWSMGVILYEMLAGRPPFDGETLPMVCARIMTESATPLRDIKPDMPPALEAVVMRCLEKDPQQRYADVPALARALAEFGPPDARIASDRISRVARASVVSLPEIALATAAKGEAVPIAAARNAAAQTRAAFAHTGPAPSPRRGMRALRLAIGGAALLAVLGVAVGVAATRGGRTTAALPPSASPIAMIASAPAAATTAVTTTLIPTASQTPAPAASSAPHATASAANTPPSKTTPSAAVAPPSHSQPRAKPMTSAAKPAGTVGFGGRD
jgi:serine/threonine-protein kinase